MDKVATGAPAIETFALEKSYSKNGSRMVALKDLNLTIQQGEIHGLLGPNGAGKTTLCRILSTVLLPTSGTARVMGLDVVRHAHEVRSNLEVSFGGDRGLYGLLTVRQNLEYWAAVSNVGKKIAAERIDSILEQFAMNQRANSRVETLSRGLKQRVHLARALVSQPDVLLLDEPTNGLDPAAAANFRTLVREVRNRGCTIVICTHDLAEAQEVCDRATLVHKGSVLITDTIEGLKTRVPQGSTITAQRMSEAALNSIKKLHIHMVNDGSRETRMVVTDPSEAKEVLNILLTQGCEGIQMTSPSLHDVYLSMLGDKDIGE